MSHPSPEFIEEYYKQGLVSTASVPRVLLLLYERLLLLLIQAIDSESDPLLMWQRLAQTQQILAHMLELFLQSQDSAYGVLYLSHEAIAQELAVIFRQRSFRPEQLKACHQQLEVYYLAWQQELQVRKRFPNEAAARLNVRRQPETEKDNPADQG